ncbi:hypothetical protein JHK85_022912 [Glycine max]|nr:hypothetical protein JHK85_022912 [Glycine max]
MAMNMYIPTKLIEEMLVKLHMKSLLGLKCVKKEWNYLISHLEFAKRHFKFGQWIEKLMIIAEMGQVENSIQIWELKQYINHTSWIKANTLIINDIWSADNYQPDTYNLLAVDQYKF